MAVRSTCCCAEPTIRPTSSRCANSAQRRANSTLRRLDAEGTDRAAHHADFVSAIETGRQPNADIEIGHLTSSLCHLGHIATRLGRTLHLMYGVMNSRYWQEHTGPSRVASSCPQSFVLLGYGGPWV